MFGTNLKFPDPCVIPNWGFKNENLAMGLNFPNANRCRVNLLTEVVVSWTISLVEVELLTVIPIEDGPVMVYDVLHVRV